MKKLIYVAMAIASASSHADVFKCTGANGKIAYQAAPCDQGANASRMKIENTASNTIPDQNMTPEDIKNLSKIKSIYLIPSSIKTSQSAKKDGMKVTVLFNDEKDKSIRVKGFDIRYSATIYEEKDGNKGLTLGNGSGKLDDEYGYYFIVKLSAREKTRIMIEASVTLPDGRKFDARDTTTFYPDPF